MPVRWNHDARWSACRRPSADPTRRVSLLRVASPTASGPTRTRRTGGPLWKHVGRYGSTVRHRHACGGFGRAEPRARQCVSGAHRAARVPDDLRVALSATIVVAITCCPGWDCIYAAASYNSRKAARTRRRSSHPRRAPCQGRSARRSRLITLNKEPFRWPVHSPYFAETKRSCWRWWVSGR